MRQQYGRTKWSRLPSCRGVRCYVDGRRALVGTRDEGDDFGRHAHGRHDVGRTSVRLRVSVGPLDGAATRSRRRMDEHVPRVAQRDGR